MWEISYGTWIAWQPSRDQAHYGTLAPNEGEHSLSDFFVLFFHGGDLGTQGAVRSAIRNRLGVSRAGSVPAIGPATGQLN
jgi:hypothetical protein